MKEIEGGPEKVPGYKFASIECGIRYENRLDYSVIAADEPCNASGMFTTNKIFAAPVKICRERINNKIKAILINSTNANACTGAEGYSNAVSLTADMAQKLGVTGDQILMASTGIIGHQLPAEKMLKGNAALASTLTRENGAHLAEAIMTTDTVPKFKAVTIDCGEREYTIGGTAKGSGMIAPDMATLLAFIVTDAPLKKIDLDRIFKDCVTKTFNSITIDGDTSTNDSAIILSPASDSTLSGENLRKFHDALLFVMMKLAEMLVADGEGVTKSVTISVTGAKDDQDAALIARSVSESLLVKTAIFGKDPNWGRIACAAGYAGAQINEETLSIYIEDTVLFSRGKPCEIDYGELEKVLSRDKYTIRIDPGLGEGTSQMLTSDISYDYVKINAEYST